MITCYNCNAKFERPEIGLEDDKWVMEMCPECRSLDLSEFGIGGRIVKVKLKDGGGVDGRVVKEVIGAFTLRTDRQLYTVRYDNITKIEFPGTHHEPLIFDE